MIKLVLEISRNNLFKYKKSESSPQKSLRISCQNTCRLAPKDIFFKEKSSHPKVKNPSHNFDFDLTF
jgi:hypothetical protein